MPTATTAQNPLTGIAAAPVAPAATSIDPGVLLGDRVVVGLRATKQAAAGPQQRRADHVPEGRGPLAVVGNGADHAVADDLGERRSVEGQADRGVGDGDALEPRAG